jgi:hypothetical protein
MQSLETPIELTQNVTPKRVTIQEKTDQLIDLLFRGHKTFTQAAKEIGVSRKTAWTYFTRWKETSEAQLVDTEWWALYLRLKDDNPEKALECLTRLKYRMTTEKKEIEKTINKTVNLNVKSMLAEYEHIITQTATQTGTIPTDDPSQPIHQAETNRETSQIPVT